jgi:hypothetical protein
LARVEITSNVSRMSKGAAMAGVGGLLAYAGLLVLLAAVVIGLTQAGLDPWLAALLVGVVVVAIGGALVMTGLGEIKKANLAPRQTAESVKENVEFFKEQVK